MTDRDEVELMLQHEQMERLRRYVIRGRELGHLGDAELIEAWLQQISAWADGCFERHSGMLEDCVSEMTLRKINPPFERAEGAMVKLGKLARQRQADLLKHPEHLAAVEAALQAKIDRLRSIYSQPKQ